MAENILNAYINNNFDKTGTDVLTTFMGFNQPIYLDPATTGFSFIFVTKPSLFLYPQQPSIADDKNKQLAYANMCKDPSFSMYITSENSNKKDQEIIKQLSYFQYPDNTTLFIPIFTNLAKSFVPNDLSLDTAQAFQTREGFSVPLPTNITQSEAAGTLSLTVDETSNFDFTKMLTLWIKYIANISNGTFSANPEMIHQNMLDYLCSIYYFVLAPDGRTLKYWSRYTGCYPLAAPYSNLGYQKGSFDNTQFDVQFQYTLKEDLNPKILEDFNMISLNIVTPELVSDNAYDEFIGNTDIAVDGNFKSSSKSTLLSKTSLYNGKYSNYVTSDNRNPIVFYQPDTDDTILAGMLPGRYILSFSNKSHMFEYAHDLLQTNSEFDYSELNDSLK